MGYRNTRLRLVFAFTLAMEMALGGCGGGGMSSQPPPGQTVTLASTVDGVAQAQMQQNGVPGMVVAVAKNGTMLYAQGYGVMDLGTNVKTPANAIYEIGSITKQFTAALILKL